MEVRLFVPAVVKYSCGWHFDQIGEDGGHLQSFRTSTSSSC